MSHLLLTEDIESIQKMIASQIDQLRETRDAIQKAGLLTTQLRTVIANEIDRLNIIDSRITKLLPPITDH